jgi:hypothetical protein
MLHIDAEHVHSVHVCQYVPIVFRLEIMLVMILICLEVVLAEHVIVVMIV